MGRSSGEVSNATSTSSMPLPTASLPIAWKQREVRVFVSSTFRGTARESIRAHRSSDMADERQSLVLHAFARLKTFCKERNVVFNFVDLRWGITAEESQGGRALSTCLREVDLCRPYFVSILGERYGWAASQKDEVFEKNIQLALETFPWVEYVADRATSSLPLTVPIGNTATVLSLSSRFYTEPSWCQKDRPPARTFISATPQLSHRYRSSAYVAKFSANLPTASAIKAAGLHGAHSQR